MKRIVLDSLQRYLNRVTEPLLQNLYQSRTSYKSYTRGRRVVLSTPPLPAVDLASVLRKRNSHRSFGQSLLQEQLETLLFWSAAESSVEELKNHRPYPSGGARYPLELYIVVCNVTGIMPGLYHYHPRHHALEEMRGISSEEVMAALDLSSIQSNPPVQNPAIVIFTSYIKQRAYDKYGIFASKLALLEVGYFGQTLYLVATALGLGCSALGMADRIATVTSTLRLDGVNEAVVQAFVLGSIPAK